MSFPGDFAVMLLWVGGGVLLAYSTYRLLRWLLPPRDGADGHSYPQAVRDMASTTGIRIAALFGILLALVYAQELRRYQDVRDGLHEEAAAISQVYFDAGRIGGEPGREIRVALSNYVNLLVKVEWPQLGNEHRLSREAWEAFDIAQIEALRLDARNPMETAVRETMIARLTKVADLRSLREHQAAESAPLLFAIPAIVGLLLVTAPFFIYPHGREMWVMQGAYGAFAGMILFFIHGFASPFSYPLKLGPVPFERLLENGFGKDAAAVDAREGDA